LLQLLQALSKLYPLTTLLSQVVAEHQEMKAVVAVLEVCVQQLLILVVVVL
jgi:hypothetical protein